MKVNLEWNDIIGYNNNIIMFANKNNGVNLPNENEIVLICDTNFYDDKDYYFVGYFKDGKYGIEICNLSMIPSSSHSLKEGMKWARFNEPDTINNVQYAIACLDENGKGFLGDIPIVVNVGRNKNDLFGKMEELKNKKYIKITCFKYITPCTFNYDWDYINKNKIEI